MNDIQLGMTFCEKLNCSGSSLNTIEASITHIHIQVKQFIIVLLPCSARPDRGWSVVRFVVRSSLQTKRPKKRSYDVVWLVVLPVLYNAHFSSLFIAKKMLVCTGNKIKSTKPNVV